MAKLNSRQIALISVFSGFYYLLSFLPGIPAPGIADIKVQVEACMATVFGYILGPYLGAATTFLGVFIAWILPPGNMSPSGVLFMPSPVINAFVSGFLFQRRWKAAAASLGALIAVFWLTPPIQPVAEFWNVGVAVTWDKIIALLLIGVVIIMDRQIRKGGEERAVRQRVNRPWLAPLLSVIASLLVLYNNFLVASTGKTQKFPFGDSSITFGYKAIITAMGGANYVWIVVGLVALFASVMLWVRPEKRKVWAVTATACSLASVITGGGFIVGALLAGVTGFFAFFGGVSSRGLPRLDTLRLFVMAFIGNEADNMWGSLIFAVPFVYEGFYGLNADVIRFLFLLSPFAYPAIRFLQAIVATMVAVPLLRTLGSAGFIPSMVANAAAAKHEGELTHR